MRLWPSAERADLHRIAGIAVPVSLELVFQLALGWIDQVIVAGLGATALAAASLANSAVFIGIVTLTSLGAGAAVLVARAHGAGRPRAVAEVFGVALLSSLALALLVTIPIALAAEPILQAIGAAPAVVVAARPYFQILVLGLPLLVVGAVTSAALRALGDARTPMAVTMGTVVLNTLLGCGLVFGIGPLPALGLVGAAWATSITQTLKAAVLLGVIVAERRGVRPALPASWAAWQATSRDLFTLTLPMTATEVFWSGGTFIYTVFFSWLGTTALAGQGIAVALEGIFVVGSIGLPAATTTLVGQAIGQGSADEARAWARRMMDLGILTGGGFGLLYLGSTLLLAILYPEVGPEALGIAAGGIVINALSQPVKVRNMILGMGVLPGGGDPRGVLLGDVVSAFGVGLPLAYLGAFVLGGGVWALFLARVAEEVVKLGIFEWRARRLRWGALAVPGEPPRLVPSTELPLPALD